MHKGLKKFQRKFLRTFFRYDPSFMDWYNHDSFKVARFYVLERIKPILTPEKKDELRILDLGCHSGRITIPLIQEGYKHIVGVDKSGMAIRTAKRTLNKMSLGGKLRKADILTYLKGCETESIDVVICIETLYLCPNYEQIVSEMMRCLKPDGYLVITLRTKLFVFYDFIKDKDYTTAHYVFHHPHGKIKYDGCNWQTQSETDHLLRILGLKCISKTLKEPFETRAELLKPYFNLYPEDRESFQFQEDLGKDIFITGQKIST